MTSAPSNPLTAVSWPTAAALGTFALLRPLASITGADDLLGKPLTPILLTVIISVVWILVAGLARLRSPFLTVLAAGAIYAVASTALSAILSPLLTGHLQGPLTNPFALVSVFGINLLWGAITGGLAWLLAQLVRERRRRRSRES
jgi:hypothetical protein